MRTALMQATLVLTLAGHPRLIGQVPGPLAPFTVPFRVPATMGPAQLTDSAFVGGAVVYRYQGQDITGFGVYTWPIPGAQGLTATGLDSLLVAQVQGFKATLPLAVRQGMYQDFEFASEERQPITTERDSIPGYVVMAAVKREGRLFASFFYIYAVQGMYVKIRLTIPEEGWDKNPAFRSPEGIVRFIGGPI